MTLNQIMKISNFPKAILESVRTIAVHSAVRRAKTAAILFTKRGRVITYAPNVHFYGKEHKNKWTIHAEEFLIAKTLKLRALNRFSDLNILVVRVNAKDEFVMAKPCKRCQTLLRATGLPVFYTTQLGTIKRIRL